MQQLLISVLEDLNNTSPDIVASAVISTDGLPMATMLPSHLNSDRVGGGDFCHVACFRQPFGARTRLRGIGTSDD